MKKVYLVIILSSICLLMGFNQSIAQCYKCGAQIDWKASIKGPKKALKKQFPNAGKVKWFKCEFDYVFGVRDFGDSTITYVQSQDKKWFAKETRYMVNVLDIEDAYGDSVSPQMITCPGPNILPKAIWSNVSKIFNVDSLDILNKVSGVPYWVCDLYKVELPDSHKVSINEKRKVFYVASMDHIFHYYSETEEVILNSDGRGHDLFYVEPELLYED